MRSLTLVVLIVAAATLGCDSHDSGYSEFDPSDVSETEHTEHAHEAPHDGVLFPLGEHQYHVEVVFAAESPRLTVFVLDAHAESAQPIAQDELTIHLETDEGETEVRLPAKPLEGESDGTSSRFEAAGEALPQAILEADGLVGHLHVTVADTDYEIDLSDSGEGHHDHHDDGHHDHGDEHGDHGAEAHSHDEEHSHDSHGGHGEEEHGHDDEGHTHSEEN